MSQIDANGVAPDFTLRHPRLRSASDARPFPVPDFREGERQPTQAFERPYHRVYPSRRVTAQLDR